MRYKVTLSYDGSSFSGWQIQNQEPTIQECLQKALKTLLKEEIAVTGAGRTDSKVHAINYVAHFDTSRTDLDTAAIGYKLNAILPPGIRVHEIVPADPEFHARFDARLREYKYFIHRNKDPFMDAYSYLYTFPLDVEAMNSAAESLLGEHNFSCFEKVGSDNKTSVCKVFYAHWDYWEPDHLRILGYPAPREDYLVFTVRADRFLRNMVRAIVGTLLDIGRGKQPPSRTEELLRGGTRSDAGESVPGHALFLSKITYQP
ncbi:MAG: tRNA pseudouridine(38-40) synthase TruA [Bacteroidales bacterium]|jgi:tRNA pseudouridine38-40 synthase|nr:tRNA pseudouridine(38-40) synthase TruA [Bacteroidota bacterium]NLN98704.1 tRNA pseudouridine(38-40) synthase TruA [Bacteroidales bacterium]